MAVSTNPVAVEVFQVPDKAQAKFSDTLDIDPRRPVLYMGDNWSGGLDVFDISGETPVFTRTVKLRGRLYGVAVAAEAGKVFVGMSGSVVAAISTEPDGPKPELIATGGIGHVDLLDYDPSRGRLYAANRLDGLLTWIDVETNAIEGRTSGLGHGLEQPRFNPRDGFVYLTDNVDNVLHQIDPETGKVRETFSLDAPCYPNGMAIDPKSNMGVLACSKEESPSTVVWDFNKQEVVDVIADLGGADGVLYEPALDVFMVAASGAEGGPVIGVIGGDPPRLKARIPAGKGASWVAYDRRQRVAYSPVVAGGRPALMRLRVSDVI